MLHKTRQMNSYSTKKSTRLTHHFQHLALRKFCRCRCPPPNRSQETQGRNNLLTMRSALWICRWSVTCDGIEIEIAPSSQLWTEAALDGRIFSAPDQIDGVKKEMKGQGRKTGGWWAEQDFLSQNKRNSNNRLSSEKSRHHCSYVPLTITSGSHRNRHPCHHRRW